MPRPSPQTDRLRWIIRLLASTPHESYTLAQIARHLDVSKATCLPTVAALTEAGWLVRHPQQKTYRLGPALIEIGRAAEQASPMDGLASSLIELCNQTGTACLVFQRSNDDLVVAEIVGPSGPRRSWARMPRGHVLPIAAPHGAVLVAWRDEDTIERWMAGAGVIDLESARPRFAAALDAARRDGFVVELQDQMQYQLFQLIERLRVSKPSGLEDLVERVAQLAAQRLAALEYVADATEPDAVYEPVSINSPVFDRYGEVQLVVCLVDFPQAVTGTEVRRYGTLVRRCATNLSRELHGTLPPSWPADP